MTNGVKEGFSIETHTSTLCLESYTEDCTRKGDSNVPAFDALVLYCEHFRTEPL